MNSFTHILCVTALGEGEDIVIRQADREARRHNARLTFVAAAPDVDRSSVLFPHLHKTLAFEGNSFERKLLNLLTERVHRLTGRSEDDFAAVADLGRPDVVGIRKAEELGADLVVTSGTNSGGHERAWLGSVADRVVRYAHCPVLVTRPDLGGKYIVAATDFSDPAFPAVEAAALQARLWKRRLILLHSLDLLRIASPVQPDMGLVWPTLMDEDIEAFSRAARDRLMEVAKTVGVKAEPVVSRETPALAIIQTARERNADQIVVGTTGRTGMPRLLLGSVAETVVRDAPCSVLVVRLHR